MRPQLQVLQFFAVHLIQSLVEVEESLMSLTQPEKELRRDLQAIVSHLRWSAVEMQEIAQRLVESGNKVDAQKLTRMCKEFEDSETRLNAYATEIRAHKIHYAT